MKNKQQLHHKVREISGQTTLPQNVGYCSNVQSMITWFKKKILMIKEKHWFPPNHIFSVRTGCTGSCTGICYFISLFTYFLRPNAPNTVCTRLTSEYPSKTKPEIIVKYDSKQVTLR